MTYFLIYLAIGIVFVGFSYFRDPAAYREIMKEHSPGMKTLTMIVAALIWPLSMLLLLAKGAALATPAGRKAQALEKQRKADEKARKRELLADEHRDEIASLINQAYALEPGSDEQQALLSQAERLERNGPKFA